MTILTDLMSRGFFPVQMPPGFSSASFAAAAPALATVWSGKTPRTRSERFSIPRSSYVRRITSIPNPLGFYQLAAEIQTYWTEIEAHYAKSQLSMSIPQFGGTSTLRAIQFPRYSELYENKLLQSAGYKFALVTDIVGYFPTIYTHTIPWALHGKAASKANTSGTPAMFGNIFDKKMQNSQDGQTVGLPIGPDTSHILAEIIGVAIDLEIYKELNKWPAGFRYVDDFFLFFNERSEAERAFAAVSRSIAAFELNTNAVKTRIIPVQELVEESWKYAIRNLTVSAERGRQRDDIHHFFETVFGLEKRYKDESLVKYALKHLSSYIVKKSNWSTLEAYLLKCGYAFPNTIQVIVTFFSTYSKYGYPINVDAVSRFANNMVGEAAISDRHGEVIWGLWLCKELHLDLMEGTVKEVERMASPSCTLVLLDLYHSGLVKTAPDLTTLMPLAKTPALYGPEWLLVYEAGRRKWLGNKSGKFIRDDKHFKHLLTANVGFYDDKATIPPIFVPSGGISPSSIDFDDDEEKSDEFDFDEMDEEYFDARGRSSDSSDDAGDGSDDSDLPI